LLETVLLDGVLPGGGRPRHWRVRRRDRGRKAQVRRGCTEASANRRAAGQRGPPSRCLRAGLFQPIFSRAAGRRAPSSALACSQSR
jgi:hypothetical protein